MLLENIIVPVKLPPVSKDNYPAFHPKMWLLQFENDEGQHKYRFIILSRNISYDKCYDVSLSLESTDDHRKTKKTKPIAEFLNFLESTIDDKQFPLLKEQKKLVRSLSKELIDEKVCFSLEDNKFQDDDFEIFPLINTVNRDNFIKKNLFVSYDCDEGGVYHEMLIMSPFITKKILNEFSKENNRRKIYLFTRQNVLDSLEPKYNKYFDTYILNEAVVLGEEFSQEDTDSEETEKDQQFEENQTESLHDIHAKIFVTQSLSNTDLYLGSANATESGFYRNIELMIRLSTTKRYFSVGKVFNELTQNPPEESIFENVKITKKIEKEQDVQQDLGNFVKKITHLQAFAKVVRVGENTFNINLSFGKLPKLPPNVQVKLKPFTLESGISLSDKIIFENVMVENLSEFYLLTAELQVGEETICIERIIKIPTEGIPYERRDSAVINKLITDKDSFAEYVTLLLSKDYVSTQTELFEFNDSNSKWKVTNTQSPLYELLLKAVVDNPEALLHLEEDLKLITNKEVVSDEFRNMYQQFLEVIKEK